MADQNREFVDNREADYAGYDNYLDYLNDNIEETLAIDELEDEEPSEVGFDHIDEFDGQPTEYEEWQDLYGGDDWDHGQFDDNFFGEY